MAQSFKHNIFGLYDSLLLLFDGLWKVKAEYMVLEEKRHIFYFS